MIWKVPFSEHSIAVPHSSESPCEACESPTDNRPPSTANRIIHRGALADPPIIDVAAGIAGRNRIDDIGFLGRQAYYAEMRTYRNAHILQDAVVLLDRGVIDGNARIVDGFVHDA